MAHTYSSIIIHSASNVEMGFSFDKLCTPKSQVLDFDIEDSEQVLEIISIFIKEDVNFYVIHTQKVLCLTLHTRLFRGTYTVIRN